jgi:hypothetical protein
MLLSCHFLEVLMVKMNSFLFRIGDPPLLHLVHWLPAAPIMVKNKQIPLLIRYIHTD